jgi:carbonic anhydrase
MDRAVRANVALVVDRLRADELLLAPAIRAGHLAVVGTYYDLEDGVVSVIVP